MIKKFYYQRTGFGYEYTYFFSGMIHHTGLMVGHGAKEREKLKKLADEWTEQDWDIEFFQHRNHTVPPDYL